MFTVSQKTSRTFWILTEQKLSDPLNFWCEYSWHNLPSNDRSVLHLT